MGSPKDTFLNYSYVGYAKQIMSRTPANTGHAFKQALATDKLAVIAEIKRRSPSAGILRAEMDVAELAQQYQIGGAVCLSVLTEATGFGGSVDDLQTAREATGLPTLRKDFVTSFEDVHETQEMGADALLLIVAEIKSSMLQPLHKLAREIGLDVLTEVRNEQELKVGVSAGADIILVNQRNQPKEASFSVDYGKAVAISHLFANLDDNIAKVAASGIGIKGGTQIKDLVVAGYDAVLIGEALVRAPEPAAMLSSLLSNS